MSTKARTQALEAMIEAHAAELKLPTVRRRFRALAAEALCCQPPPSRMAGSPAAMTRQHANVMAVATNYSAVTSVIAARAEDSSTIAFLSA